MHIVQRDYCSCQSALLLAGLPRMMRMVRVGLLACLLALGPSSALATVTTTTQPTVSYSPSVNTSTFTVTFPFDMAGDLVVTKITDATSAETVLTYGSDYTVRLPVGSTNGSITTTVAVTSDYSIRIERDTAPTQLRSFRRQGTYNADQHERAHNRTIMALQDAVFTAGESADDAVADHEAESDPHTGYAKLLGRSGGQHLQGSTDAGENLQLSSTAHATKGLVILGDTGTELVIDDVNDLVGIGTAAPTRTLHVVGTGAFTDDLTLTGGASALILSASDSSIVLGDNDSTALLVGSTGTLDLLTLDTTNSAEALTLGTDVDLILTGTAGYILAPYLNGGDGSGDNLQLNSTQHATKGLILLGSSSAFDDVNERLGLGTTSPTYSVHATGFIHSERGFVTGSGTLTCADNGLGTAAACTATNAEVLGLIEITCNDANGCDLTLDETSGTAGTQLILVNVSTNTVTLVDSAGVQETAATALGQYDTATLCYGTGRWYQTAASNN